MNPEDRYKYQILKVCEELHNHVTHASEPLQPDILTDYIDFLSMRLQTWEPTTLHDDQSLAIFDDAVKNLAMVTLQLALGCYDS